VREPVVLRLTVANSGTYTQLTFSAGAHRKKLTVVPARASPFAASSIPRSGDRALSLDRTMFGVGERLRVCPGSRIR
jgi:hypothetical protein